MKYNAKQYAQALYDAVVDKSQSEIKPFIRDFVSFLSVNNDMAKLNEIILNFSGIWDRKKGIVSVELVSARKLGESVLNALKSMVAKRTDAKEVYLNNIIEGAILGGTVVKYRDKILDISLKSKLVNLKKVMIK